MENETNATKMNTICDVTPIMTCFNKNELITTNQQKLEEMNDIVVNYN